MPFSPEEINEFKVEAGELLDSAEKSLMALDRGEAFSAHYDALFRVFHSLKGAAGMMELTAVQAHMHQLETIFTEQKGKPSLDKSFIDFFLRGTDSTRLLLEGQAIDFDYVVGAPKAAPAAAAAAELPTAAPELRKPASPGAAAPAAAPIPARPPAQKVSGRVLLVDDEPELVEVLRELLSDGGFEVIGTTLPDAVEALIESYQPDVVLSDISMPRITGQDLLQAIRRKHPDLPVVFLSGHVDKAALLQGISNGVYAVIEKPFNYLQVVECCTNAAKKYQLTKLVQRSLHLLLYQFSDLDKFLLQQGKEDVRNSIRFELKEVLEQFKQMRHPAKGA